MVHPIIKTSQSPLNRLEWVVHLPQNGIPLVLTHSHLVAFHCGSTSRLATLSFSEAARCQSGPRTSRHSGESQLQAGAQKNAWVEKGSVYHILVDVERGVYHQGTAGFSPCLHLPGLRFGYLFLTYTHIFVDVERGAEI